MNDLSSTVQRVCPKGVDVFYDNVGGLMAEAIMKHMNDGWRASYVGVTQNYNDVDENGRPWTWKMDKPMFIVHDYVEQYDEGRKQMSEWIKDGKLTYRDDIVDGLENAPEAFIGLFAGTNIGKRLVRVNQTRINGEPA